VAERQFDPLPTDKVIHQWRKQKEELQKLDKKMFFLYACCNIASTRRRRSRRNRRRMWLTDRRNSGIPMFTKIIFEAKRWVVTLGITDFAGRAYGATDL
jgi:hypothetical protein